MRLAGGGFADEMDLNEFLAQAEEYRANKGVLDQVMKVLNTLRMTHPFLVMRAALLRDWIEEGAYDRVLRGEYPRRTCRPDPALHARSLRARLQRRARARRTVLAACGPASLTGEAVSVQPSPPAARGACHLQCRRNFSRARRGVHQARQSPPPSRSPAGGRTTPPGARRSACRHGEPRTSAQELRLPRRLPSES